MPRLGFFPSLLLLSPVLIGVPLLSYKQHACESSFFPLIQVSSNVNPILALPEPLHEPLVSLNPRVHLLTPCQI